MRDLLFLFAACCASTWSQTIPNTGQQITPLAPPSAQFVGLNPQLADAPNYLAGQAVTTVVSPDHSTVLILTSGYNLYNYPSGPNQGKQNPADSNEYVFVYDIAGAQPVQQQVIQVPNTYNGIAFDPSGTSFYVAGGKDDDVHIYAIANGVWAEQTGSPVKLNHKLGNGLVVLPEAAGVAITQDGNTLLVTNYYNDSVSFLTKSSNTWAVTAELDLRPGKENPANSGVPGGEYPLWVSVKGSTTAFVSSIRDREIDVVNIAATPSVTLRIPVKGQPNKMTLSDDQSLLYVAQDQTDSVAVIDTTTDKVIEDIPAGPPSSILPSFRAGYTGNNTNSVTVTPDGKQLYVTNGNTNNIAVIQLSTGVAGSRVIGLIPTGWYPNSVSFSGDGKTVYVVNGKSPTGANPGNCYGGVIPTLPSAQCAGSNQYDLQLLKAGFQYFPTPNLAALTSLTRQVATNNNFNSTPNLADTATIGFLRNKIQHVIYIIKENRTYDQVLGDLPQGNGDPSLTEFGAGITPNLHNLASTFGTLDNFYDRSEVSMDGWPWSVSARAPDVVERQVTVNYASRGLSNDSEGTNRNVNVSYPTQAQRSLANPLTPHDPDVLPGTTDTSAPDGPDNEVNKGYIWDAALRAGLTIRNYGFFLDLARYELPGPIGIPEVTDPAATGTVVALSTSQALRPFTDPYFRGFDNAFPDYYRFQEWAREFNTTYQNGGLPQISFVRLMHDHTGNFGTAILGVNTPELQVADNDYAVGLLVQTVAHSQYKSNTLIFVIEDDSQDGGDHVESHRSIAFIAGPYVKQRAVISTPYNTVDFLRTIELVLGLKPLNLNDSLGHFMTDVFDTSQTAWSFTATPPSILYNTQLPLPPNANQASVPKPAHDSAFWAAATKGLDFSSEDKVDPATYNHILWKGLMGDKPYPEVPSGLDLRKNRAELLARYKTN